MFLKWGASDARDRVNRYEKRLDKAELKYIVHLIQSASKHGHTSIKLRGEIKDKNIHILKKNGYKISSSVHNIYEIKW